MTWHTNNSTHSTSSQEREAAFSLTSYLDTIQSELAKSRNIQEMSYSQDNETESCQTFQSGMTCAHSTESLGEDQLMFFAEDFHAKTLQQGALCTELKELRESVADYGANIKDLLAKCGLSLFLPKTPHYCELEGLESSCKTLPSWGMMQDGASLELGTLERHIEGIDFGFWATPNSRDYKDYPSGKKVRKDGKRRVDQTPRQVYAATDGSGLFTPPTAPETWMMITSNAMDVEVITQAVNVRGRAWTKNTTTKKGREFTTRKKDQIGLLNAEFSEWLMGWPIGWTDLRPLEMGKCPNAQLWHGAFFQKD